ncbi:serine aminopeptidase S33 family [Nocardia caishijiensis]|uniref:Serine aminopeptidase S33 family n=2 Tax=Nocardia caishijiensis TaxID=184756 RepID=A0ABQ6YLL7_9NOCA|nr:serine aminopeptidase S33 family [Nocardia caishijiensis]
MAVILLHGLGQQSADYHRFARFLTRHHIDVWGIDHPGHGLSEGTFDDIPPIEDLAAAALHLTAIARSADSSVSLALVGHSLGAGTALIAMQATSHGVRDISRVVLTGTPELAHTLAVPGPGVPTLALHGRDDRRARIDTIRMWCADQPTVTLREVPDAGHDLLHEPAHRAVAETIVDFLTGEMSPERFTVGHRPGPRRPERRTRRSCRAGCYVGGR